MTVNISLADRRFVDRDMIMRYHWGLAIGHTYMHGNLQVDTSRLGEGVSDREEAENMDADGHTTLAEHDEEDASMINVGNDKDAEAAVIPETEEGTDDECRDDCDYDVSDLDDEEGSGQDEEEQLELDEMYGESADIEYYE